MLITKFKKRFVNPFIFAQYEKLYAHVPAQADLYAGAFVLSEKDAVDLGISSFRQAGHKLNVFIDACDTNRREFVSRCGNCLNFLYLYGDNGNWDGFISH